MKTARQSGWSMSINESDNFLTLYNDYGDYCELSLASDGTVNFFSAGNTVSLFDLPRSVLSLCELWLGVSLSIPSWR